MRPWSRIAPEEYWNLPLRAHSLLADIPLHDVWRVSLPGGRRCTMEEIRAVAMAADARSQGFLVRTLFAVRRFVGILLRWDSSPEGNDSWSLRSRLTDEDVDLSLVPPGTRDGPFEVVYVHRNEAVSEIRNATVQAYLVWAITSSLDGHQMFWAIHVIPVSRWTRPYMTLIDPFRRFIVYPSLLGRFHDAWVQAARSAV